MQITYIGSPSQIFLEDSNITTTLQTTFSKLGKQVSVLDIPDQKTAKLLLVILNWSQVKNNPIIKQSLSAFHHLVQKFDRLEKQSIQSYPSTLAFHHKLFKEWKEKITDEEIMEVLRKQSSIAFDVCVIGENVPMKVVESVKARKPTRLASVVTYLGDKVVNVYLGIEERSKAAREEEIKGKEQKTELRNNENINRNNNVQQSRIERSFRKLPVLLQFFLILFAVIGMSYLMWKFEDDDEPLDLRPIIEQYRRYFPKETSKVQRNIDKTQSKTKIKVKQDKSKDKQLMIVQEKKPKKNKKDKETKDSKSKGKREK